MRWTTLLLITLACIGVAVAIWYASGGRFVLFMLPLLFGLPLLGRRR